MTFRGGTTSADRTYYETSRYDGPFLHFPAGRRYDLPHGLSEPPAEFHVYLSFTAEPLPDGQPGAGVAESAGNQAVVERIDDEILQVRNDTCAEFFMRLVARTGSPQERTADADSPDGG